MELTNEYFNTSYAPLCILGQLLWERGTLDRLRNFAAIPMKKRDHTPGEKLLDALLALLAGYPSLYLFNSKLSSDPMLAEAWHREKFADQSMVSRTLDACPIEGLDDLREIGWDFWRNHSQLITHDWRKRIVFDLDLSPLPASRLAQDSTKGYLGKKNATGCQLARSRIQPYRETLLSQLDPGYQHSSNCLVPAVESFEQLLPLPEQYRAKVTWRLDGGFGGDPNVNWLLIRHYGLVTKGCSNRRSAKLFP